MPAYLGTLGRLVPIRCTAQPVSASDRYTFERTLEGKVKAQRKAMVRRSWAVSAGLATADQIAALWGFADGEWGNGPFVWVTPEAQVTNLLTPEVARCGPQAVFSSAVSRSGPMALEGGGWSGASLTTSDLAGTLWVGASKAPVPVLPGKPVTASADLIGAGGKVRLHWVAADGSALIGTVTSTGTGVAGAPRRLHATGVPPAGAVSCAVSTTGAPQITRPAITWTAEPVPFSPGNGCEKAVIDGPERDPRLLTAAHYRANASFTVTEVG